MKSITANDLKTKSVSAIQDGAIITVRGKEKLVILTLKEYDYLRECELTSSLNQAKKDLENGEVIEESIDEHIKRIKNV